MTFELGRVAPIARGAHTGWCRTCGGETFNFVRHRCPKRIHAKTFAVMLAASKYCRARTAVRCATVGTLNHAQLEKKEAEAFEQLQAAVAAANEGNTNGPEE